MNTMLSTTAVMDLGVSCGLPIYLADEVAARLEGEFVSEATAIFAIDIALDDLRMGY